MHKAKVMANGFHDRFGGPFHEARDGSGSADCNCYQRPAMAGRRNASGESCQDEVSTWHELIKGYICRSWSEQQEELYRMQEKDAIQDT
jgi:hypothetical protein